MDSLHNIWTHITCQILYSPVFNQQENKFFIKMYNLIFVKEHILHVYVYFRLPKILRQGHYVRILFFIFPNILFINYEKLNDEVIIQCLQ
jgi:hypothetical protein